MSASNDEITQLADQAMRAAVHEAQNGQVAQAGALYRAVLELLPGHPDAHFGLALLEQQAGQADAAIEHFATALQGAPEQESYWLHYLDALIGARRFATAREVLDLGKRHGLQGEAVDALEQQLANESVPATDEIDAAAALFAQGRLAAAGEAARALTERFPQHAFGWKLLAAVLYKQRAIGLAMEAMQRAVHYAPDDAETLSNLGLLLTRDGRSAQAIGVLERSLALAPDSAHAHHHMAVALMEMGRLVEAHASAGTALRIDPALLEAWNTIAVILDNLGRSTEAVDAYRRVLAVNPDHTDAHGNMLFCMSHMESVTPAALFEEHRLFGQRLAMRTAAPAAWENTPEPGRRLRIGFISGDLRNHAVASFIEPMLKRLAARPGLALYAYYNHVIQDTVSARVRETVAQWRDIAELDDAAAEALIRADGIDILIDLAGHTSCNRLPVLARKPAPLQASWIGYPGSTGLAAVDYFLTDQYMTPPGQYDHLFTEKLVYLPAVVAFEPARQAPELAALPALTNGYLSFGSFNRLSKISRKVIAVWGALLRALPDARLVMAGMPKRGGGHEQLQTWLQEEGIDPARTSFHPRSGMHDYLSLHNRIDICLDTFPYSGGTTTLHALYMGVPMLTLTGDTMAGRQSTCLLAHHGLAQFIARDAEDFVAKGLAASRDLAALAHVRSTLRATSPLWTPDGVERIADGLEQALRLMWERWCAGEPAHSIDASRLDARAPA